MCVSVHTQIHTYVMMSLTFGRESSSSWATRKVYLEPLFFEKMWKYRKHFLECDLSAYNNQGAQFK